MWELKLLLWLCLALCVADHIGWMSLSVQRALMFFVVFLFPWWAEGRALGVKLWMLLTYLHVTAVVNKLTLIYAIKIEIKVWQITFELLCCVRYRERDREGEMGWRGAERVGVHMFVCVCVYVCVCVRASTCIDIHVQHVCVCVCGRGWGQGYWAVWVYWKVYITDLQHLLGGLSILESLHYRLTTLSQ